MGDQEKVEELWKQHRSFLQLAALSAANDDEVMAAELLVRMKIRLSRFSATFLKHPNARKYLEIELARVAS